MVRCVEKRRLPTVCVGRSPPIIPQSLLMMLSSALPRVGSLEFDNGATNDGLISTIFKCVYSTSCLSRAGLNIHIWQILRTTKHYSTALDTSYLIFLDRKRKFESTSLAIILSISRVNYCCNKKKWAWVASISFFLSLFFLHLRQSVAQKPLLLASAASRSPVTLERPTVTRLGENNNLPKTKKQKRRETKRERKKKNLENVATATDFLRTLSLPLVQQQKTKEQENNIPFKCRRPLYFRPYSVHNVWWYIGSDETLIFLFFVATLVILFFLRQNSIYKYELSISVFFRAVCGCGTPRKETRNTFCNFFARRQPSVRD